MKIRSDFVTNSSSSSFVLSRKEIGEDHATYIENNFVRITLDELYNLCEGGDVEDVYYLVDYNGEDIMHVWVSRDESMWDDAIDDALFDHNKKPEISSIVDFEY